MIQLGWSKCYSLFLIFDDPNDTLYYWSHWILHIYPNGTIILEPRTCYNKNKCYQVMECTKEITNMTCIPFVLNLHISWVHKTDYSVTIIHNFNWMAILKMDRGQLRTSHTRLMWKSEPGRWIIMTQEHTEHVRLCMSCSLDTSY